MLHFIDDVFGGGEVRRRCRHLLDGARGEIWSKAELDRLRNKILHRNVHVFVEIQNDRVMLQIRPERFLIVCVRDEHMRAGPGVDVLQEGDEGLALIGFAIAPAEQCGSKHNAHSAARGAIENLHHYAAV